MTSQPIRLSTNFITLIPSLTFTVYKWFPWSICNGCGMSAGNAYPSEHLVSSLIMGLANCWERFSRTCRVFSQLLTLNFPRYFPAFASFNWPPIVGVLSLCNRKFCSVCAYFGNVLHIVKRCLSYDCVRSLSFSLVSKSMHHLKQILSLQLSVVSVENSFRMLFNVHICLRTPMVKAQAI